MNRALAGAFAAWALLASPAEGLGQQPVEPPSRRQASEFSGLVARDQPFDIEADHLTYEQARDVYEASGNVVVRQRDGATLTADWLTFSATTRIGVASGNVVIRQGDDIVRSEFTTVDLRRMVAMATHAVVDTPDPGFTFEGERVRKTGVNTYSLEHAIFSTCRCPPDAKRRPWQIEAERADVRVGGYAVARNVTFLALGLPLLYTPWLAVPVKTERQTGFLIPAFEASSRNGATFGAPFFWTPSDRVNVLLRPTFYTERGFATYAETEYVFGERGFGRAGGAILPSDQEVSSDRVRPADPAVPYDPDTPFSETRYGYFWRHEHPLAEGLRFGTDVNRASDNEYPVDFDDLDSRFRNARFMESTGYASYGRGAYFGGIELSYNDDLQNPQDLDRDRRLLQRLPDVQLTRLPDRLPFFGELFPRLPLRASLDTRYTYFFQRDRDATGRLPTAAVGGRFFDTGPDGIFDVDETGPLPDPTDPTHLDRHRDLGSGGELDGVFQEGELLADRGHRIEVEPRLSLPARLGLLELLGEVGVRETLYYTDLADQDSRTAFTGRFDVRTRFGRGFAIGQAQVDHLVEPGIAIGVIQSMDESGTPLLIPEPAVRPRRLIDGDLRTLLRSPTDRLEDERLLIASLGNRFYTRSGSAETSRLLAEIRFSGGYDFERDGPANLFLDSALHPWRNLSLEGQVGYDPDETRLEEALAAITWRGEQDHRIAPSGPERRHRVSLSYRYLRELPPFFEEFRRSDEVFEDFEQSFDRVAQLNLEGIWVATRVIDLFAAGYTSLESSEVSGGSIGALIHSRCACWRLRVELARRVRPDDTRLRVNLQLAGFGL